MADLRCVHIDAETGFVYLRARYYDPATGQFLTRDPLVALTRSAYGYVGGNPLNGSDPLGLFCLVHNSNGGCRGSGVIKEAQKPIAVIGLAAAGVSALAADVGLACSEAGLVACVGVAKVVSFGAGAVNSVATLEEFVDTCQTQGAQSTSCRKAIAAVELSVSNTFVRIVADPLTQVGLANANYAASAAEFADATRAECD